MFKLLIVLVCSSRLILHDVGGQIPVDKCKLDQFYVPYIRLHKKANGPVLEERTARGFFDMREQIHKIACINGPVIIYESVKRNENQDFVFSDAKIKVFSHDCFIVNQVKSAKVSELQGKGLKKINMLYVSPWDVIGQAAAGMFLLSNVGDYTAPVATFLANDNLDFTLSSNEKSGVRGGSFVTIGVGPFCLHVDNLYDIAVSGGPASNSICHWSLSGSSTKPDKAFRKRYRKIFNGRKKLSQFEWGVCTGASGLEPIPITPKTTTEPTVTYEPFALINPMYTNQLNFDAIESNAVKIITDPSPGGVPIREFNNLHGGDSDEDKDDYDPDNPPDLVITMDPDDCITIPPKATSVPSTCGPGGVGEFGCWFLAIALGSPQIVGPPAVPPVLEKELKWKQDVIYIASEIFGHICEPFSPDMPYIFARFFEYYLAKAHEDNPEIPTMPREKWKYVTAEFSRCMTDIAKTDSRMLWYWDSRDDRETFGPPTKYYEKFLDEPSPVCKAVECSEGCEPVDDKCMPFVELEEYCLSLGVKRCRENITICYVNKEKEICDLGLECEVLDCPDDGSSGTRCVPEGDRCMETHLEEVDFDTARDKKEQEDRENSIDLLVIEEPGDNNETMEAGGVGLGDDTKIKDDDAKKDDSVDKKEPEKTPGQDEPKGNNNTTDDSSSGGTGETNLIEQDAATDDLQFDSSKDGGGPINPTYEGETFTIQEVYPEKSRRKYHYDGYPVNVMLITNIEVEDIDNKKPFKDAFWGERRRKKRQADSREKLTNRKKKRKQMPTTVYGECLYFYEEAAETAYDLNVVIDIFWKIFATSLGYCNKHFGLRKSETFPNLYAMFVEDFIVHIEDEWKFPKGNEGMKAIFDEFVSERGQRWLDVCLESAYIISNTTTYRPPRPMKLGNGNTKGKNSNYFLQLPDYLNENYMWSGDEEYVAVSCPN